MGTQQQTLAFSEEAQALRKKLTAKFQKMIKALYQQQGATFNVSLLAEHEAQEFINTHTQVLDDSFRQVEMSEGMRQRLSRSNYIFSGIKTFHELGEAFPSLLQPDGSKKPFNQFLNDVRSIDATYNSNYLQSEYNFAHASAAMAAKWERYAADGEDYNLQYRTAGDEKVRASHAAMEGITLPITDKFWEEYYPPNGWNCRCNVIQVLKDKYPQTPSDEAARLGDVALERDTKGIFRFNSGKQQKTFPDYNPYTIRRCNDCSIAKGKDSLAFVPENELCAACAVVHSCFDKRKDSVKLKETERFFDCDVKNGELRVSSHHGANEKKYNIMVAQYLAEKYGYSIDLIANPPGKRSADSYNHTLGYSQEYKVSREPTRGSIDGLLRKAKGQSVNVVLWIDSNIADGTLANAIRNRVRLTDCERLTIIRDNKDCTYTREEILKETFKIQRADFK